jgi:hypothetical protein
MKTSGPFGFLKFLIVAGVGLFGDGFLNISIGLGQSLAARFLKCQD